MPESQLRVGDPTRERAGRIILISLALATAFLVVTWWSKEASGLNLHQPWQDDPYDVVVSLDFAGLPLLISIAALRVQLCRRDADLPVRRLVDLLRVCGAAVCVCLVTESSEWTAVALGLHREAWTAATTWQVAALVALTGATVVVAGLLSGASRSGRRIGRPDPQPDWLADAVDLGRRAAPALGRRSSGALAAAQWTDTHVFSRVRRHPLSAAAVVAGLLAAPFVVAKIVLEHYPPLLVLLSFAMPAAGLFAFVVLVGRFLRIVAPREESPTIWPGAIVAACISGPLLFAFHDALLPHPTALGLIVLLFGGGVIGGTISAAGQLVIRFAGGPHFGRRGR